MSAFPFRGRNVVMVSGVCLILAAIIIMAVSFAPSEEKSVEQQYKLDSGGISTMEFRDLRYGSDFSVSVDVEFDSREDTRISIYFLDEEGYDNIMGMLENGTITKIADGLPLVDSIHSQVCTEDTNFDFTANYDGIIRMIISNEGGEQEFTVVNEIAWYNNIGVCFFMFVIIGVLGVMVSISAWRVQERY